MFKQSVQDYFLKQLEYKTSWTEVEVVAWHSQQQGGRRP